MVQIEDTLPDSSSGGWSKPRVIFLSVSAIALVALLVAVREVLLPFILALIIAYVLTPLVAFGEQRLKMPRSVSIIVVYLAVLSVVGLGVAGMAPRIYDESVAFVREVPSMTHTLAEKHGPRLEKWVNAYAGNDERQKSKQDEPAFSIEARGEGYAVELGDGVDIVQDGEGHWRITPHKVRRPGGFQVSAMVDDGMERFVEYVQMNALEFVKLGQTIVSTFSRFVLLVFMTLMVAGYVMHTRESIMAFFRSLPPKMHQPGFDFLVRRIDRGLAGVVRGQLLICVVNGVLSAIGFAVFGLKYWPVLALLAGVMSIIPIFGSILSTVPAVLIGLTQDFWIALWVLVWILAVHQVEANFLNPKIIGAAAKIHPVLVVFSLLVGEHFFDLWGALFAVPVLSITQSVFNHFRYSLPDVEADSLLVPELSGRAGSD